MRKNFSLSILGFLFNALMSSVDTLVRVGDVQKEVLLVVLLVKAAHRGGGWGDDIVYEEKQGIFGAQADSLTNEEVKLSDSQIRGNEVFLLV